MGYTVQMPAIIVPDAINLAADILHSETGRHVEWIRRRLREQWQTFADGNYRAANEHTLRVMAAAKLLCNGIGLSYEEYDESRWTTLAQIEAASDSENVILLPPT